MGKGNGGVVCMHTGLKHSVCAVGGAACERPPTHSAHRQDVAIGTREAGTLIGVQLDRPVAPTQLFVTRLAAAGTAAADAAAT